MSSLKWIAKFRPQIRRVLDIRNEYRIRRTLYRIMPSSHVQPDVHFLHCCVWKTASQWVRLMLSAPLLYRHHGHLPYVSQDVPADFRRGAMLTSLYWTYDQCRSFFETAGAGKAIFVVRDPRDLLVSRYFSDRFAHDPNPINLEKRKKLDLLDTEDAIDQTIDGFARIGQSLWSWARDAPGDSRIHTVKYEEITGGDKQKAWRAIFDHYEIRIPDREIERLLTFYDFSNLKGRKMWNGGTISKYRSGRHGDWQRVLSPRNLEKFEKQYGGLIDALSYR